jgi:hypothetical protein
MGNSQNGSPLNSRELKDTLRRTNVKSFSFSPISNDAGTFHRLAMFSRLAREFHDENNSVIPIDDLPNLYHLGRSQQTPAPPDVAKSFKKGELGNQLRRTGMAGVPSWFHSVPEGHFYATTNVGGVQQPVAITSRQHLNQLSTGRGFTVHGKFSGGTWIKGSFIPDTKITAYDRGIPELQELLDEMKQHEKTINQSDLNNKQKKAQINDLRTLYGNKMMDMDDRHIDAFSTSVFGTDTVKDPSGHFYVSYMGNGPNGSPQNSREIKNALRTIGASSIDFAPVTGDAATFHRLAGLSRFAREFHDENDSVTPDDNLQRLYHFGRSNIVPETIYGPTERSFRQVDKDRLEKALKKTLKKGQLRNDKSAERLVPSDYGIKKFLAEPVTDRDVADTSRPIITYRGRRYLVPQASLQSRDLQPEDRLQWLVDGRPPRRMHNMRQFGISEYQFGQPPIVFPYSLRQFLREHRFPDGKYENIVDDNATAQALDASSNRNYYTRVLRQKHARRPAYLFAPGVYEKMMKYLSETGDAWRDRNGRLRDPSRRGIIRERSGIFFGTKHVDPESGVPWVHVTHAMPTDFGWSDTLSTMPQVHHSFNALQKLIRRNPGLYACGDIHAHPPDGNTVPSRGDLQGIHEFWTPNGESAFHMIMGTGAFIDKNGNLVHGHEAPERLDEDAIAVRAYDDPSTGEPLLHPSVPRITLPYSHVAINSMDSGTDLGHYQSLVNMFTTVSGDHIVPLTYGYGNATRDRYSGMDMGRGVKIMHPHMVTLIHPRGGEAEHPYAIGFPATRWLGPTWDPDMNLGVHRINAIASDPYHPSRTLNPETSLNRR